MNPRRVAFATYERAPLLTADDRLAARALEESGVTVIPAIWSDGSIEWRGFDAVVLRSTWDYHQRPAEFRDWLAHLESRNVPLWNPVPLARWNLDKRYLRDLEQRGVRIVPTIWLEEGTEPELDAVMSSPGWETVVAKPFVAATSYRTRLIEHEVTTREPARARAALREMLAHDGVMLQPLLAEVAAEGEWSLIFFAGEFSHAVLKRPAAGEFRVQAEFGGTATVASAPAQIQAAARAVLDRIDEPWIYARVDGVRRDGQLLLMELEVLEPSLFLALQPTAPARFAEAILSRLR